MIFEKVYVISLKNSKRREKIQKNLNQIGLDFEFFDAYDGKIFKHLHKKLDNSYLTNPNYVACSLSHLAVYNHALECGYKKILILEDDAVPNKDFKSLLDKFEPQIPETDLLYLGWVPLSDDTKYWNYNVINDRFISENVFEAKNLWCLYAYVISDNLMRHTIDKYNDSFPMEIDRYFVEVIQPLYGYGVRPQLFCHDATPSSNLGYTDNSALLKSVDSRVANINDYLI
jgi:GR25 family glycosyltransferase involved in LPS biosynthesis